MTSFQGIIFDFNGVLLWDSPLHEQAWRQISIELRGESLTDEEIAAHVHGRHNRDILAYLTGRPAVGAELRQLAHHKETIYRQLCLAPDANFVLSPGAVGLLDFLVGQHIPHTIATASGKDNLDFYLKHLELSRWFDPAQIVYDDGLRPGKPAPDIYQQAARNLDLPSARCVVVEDSRSGLQAAYAAGIGQIIALGPAQTHPHLLQLRGVDRVVESLQQFPREELFMT